MEDACGQSRPRTLSPHRLLITVEEKYTADYINIEKTHWWFAARIKILATLLTKIMPITNSGRLLNVGPAGGSTTHMLKKFGYVRSLEFDEALYNHCKNNERLEVDPGSITELPYGSETFDYACAFDVIEHVQDDQRALAELARVINSKGLVFITVPAFAFLWSEHDEINHHFKRYTLSSLISVGKTAGLEPVYSTYFNFLLFPFIASIRMLTKLKRKKGGGDFDDYKVNGLANKLLQSIFQFEEKLLFPAKMPFGVSAFVAFRKASKE